MGTSEHRVCSIPTDWVGLSRAILSYLIGRFIRAKWGRAEALPWGLCQFVAGCTLDRLTLGHKPTLNRVAHDSSNLLRADHAVAVERHRELKDHIAVNQLTNLGRTVGLTSHHLGDYSIRESDQLTLSLGRARLGATLAGLGGLLGHVLKRQSAPHGQHRKAHPWRER